MLDSIEIRYSLVNKLKCIRKLEIAARWVEVCIHTVTVMLNVCYLVVIIKKCVQYLRQKIATVFLLWRCDPSRVMACSFLRFF